MLRRMSTNKPSTQDGALLDALLNSWDRNNTILVNLLRALPDGGMELRAVDRGDRSTSEPSQRRRANRSMHVLARSDCAQPTPPRSVRKERRIGVGQASLQSLRVRRFNREPCIARFVRRASRFVAAKAPQRANHARWGPRRPAGGPRKRAAGDSCA
jgi:hypothetical protein